MLTASILLKACKMANPEPSPESFQYGALRLFRGMDIDEFDEKRHRIIMLHNLIWGVELCLGEIIPQNPSHGDGMGKPLFCDTIEIKL